MKAAMIPVAVAVTLAAGGIAGTALAAPAGTVRPGLYSGGGGPQGSASIDVNVIDHGRALERGAIVACSSGRSPGTGLPANTTLFLVIPRRVRISARRTFAYSGRALAEPVGFTRAAAVPVQLVLKGRFVGGPGKAKSETIGLRGSFDSSVCSSPRTLFSYIWA
jgi:hypothetical protein